MSHPQDVDSLAFAGVVRSLESQPDYGSTLQSVCEWAVTILGADDAAMTVIQHGRFTTVAATGDLPLRVDRIQYQAGEGPCLESLAEGELLASPDLQTEQRWPAFSTRAVNETGVRSMISHRLSVREGVIGALNVYSRRPHVFSDEDLSHLKIFTTHAAVALQASETEAKVTELERALSSNRRIGMAVGIVMAGRGLTGDAAFQALRKASMDGNRKLVEVAEDVIYTGRLDDSTSG